MTQAQFAHYFGVTLPTIGRWESYSPPTGINLERLALLAKEKGAAAAADFQSALKSDPDRAVPMWAVRLGSEEDTRCVNALLYVLHHRDHARLRPALFHLLQPGFKAIDGFRETHANFQNTLQRLTRERPELLKPGTPLELWEQWFQAQGFTVEPLEKGLKGFSVLKSASQRNQQKK